MPNEKRMHQCAYCSAQMAAARPHIYSICMQSVGQEALESKILWDSTTEGLRTCEYLSHILTKPPLLIRAGRREVGCLKRCQIQRKGTRYAMSLPG